MGNLFSYLISYLYVKQNNGYIVLRIEDLDPARSKIEYVESFFRELEFFGFEYEGEIIYQSRRTDAYEAAYDTLNKKRLLYPCFCSRADLLAAGAPHPGEENVYSGVCRSLTGSELVLAQTKKTPAIRLIVPEEMSYFVDLFQGHQLKNLPKEVGDFIIRRSDGVYAYQLAVVVDDYFQGVNTVIRGSDLLNSTHKQLYIAKALGLCSDCSKALTYGHIPLIVNSRGVRLSKRDNNASLEYLLEEKHYSAQYILSLLCSEFELIPKGEILSLEELISYADLSKLQDKKQLVWN